VCHLPLRPLGLADREAIATVINELLDAAVRRRIHSNLPVYSRPASDLHPPYFLKLTIPHSPLSSGSLFNAPLNSTSTHILPLVNRYSRHPVQQTQTSPATQALTTWCLTCRRRRINRDEQSSTYKRCMVETGSNKLSIISKV
jgi:hypothetical protein